MLTFSILGSLEARAGDEPVTLGPFKQRVVLALLLCHANRVVPVAALREALWEDDPPRTAGKNLQVYVCALRRMLAGGTPAAKLRHTPPGYTLQLCPEQLDSLRFNDLAQRGRRAVRNGETEAAAALLEQAIRLWRGPALADLAGARLAEAEALGEQYLAAQEDWAEAKLDLGDHADLAEKLDDLVRGHPFRERLRRVHMLALYRCGRQAEALAQFEDVRQGLARELGIQPSPVLVRLYESILVGDPGLDAAPIGRAPVGLSATGAPGGNLTRDLADFAGHDREVDAVEGVLSSAQSATVTAITGPTGVGKTALAVHCAHRLSHRFPDARVLVSLRTAEGAPRPVADLFGDLLRSLRVGGPLPDRPAERAALVRQAAEGRRMLFILDDAASEAQVRAVLAATGDTDVVTTSRRHLGGLEATARVRVAPMSDREALAMLGRIIGARRVAAEPVAARRLIEVCEGMPLLVRIAGAKLDALRHLSLARYAERLADEGHLLDQFEAGDLRLRPRLAVAYRDLDPDDQVTLHQLARLPRPSFSTADAAAALRTDPLGAEAAVERLIEAHVVDVSQADVEADTASAGVRYVLPKPIRLFVRHHLAPAE